MAASLPAEQRVFGGFGSLEGGMNGGVSPSLIGQNQCALAVNLTFRGGFATTRPTLANKIITYTDAATQSRFTGKWQGASFYRSNSGDDRFIIARGGRLFTISPGPTWKVSEVTIRMILSTTADFTVPALNGSVNVSVNSVSTLAINQNIIIDSGNYTITNIATQLITVTYNGAAAHATAVAGNTINDALDVAIQVFVQNNSNDDTIFSFQAENYSIICCNQNTTKIFGGQSVRQAVPGELPPATLGIYLWGRIWLSLSDSQSFVAGDLVRGSSGTVQTGYVDSILKMTENTLIAGGGAFSIPISSGKITSMAFLSQLDTSLGVSNLLVGTDDCIFSVNTPVDRTVWQDVTYPIQTVSNLENGPLGCWNWATVKSDMWYRSDEGINSFQVARRDVNKWVVSNISQEMASVLDFDTEELLPFGSMAYSDKKLFATCSPERLSSGIIHHGLVVANFDLISNLNGVANPCWDGVLSGINTLQVLTVKLARKKRTFAFAFAADNQTLEVWELRRGSEGYYDEYTTIDGNGLRTVHYTPIESVIEGRSDPFGNPSQLKKLVTASLYLDDMVDTVTITVRWKPDQHPVWTEWTTLTLCANVSECQVPHGTSCNILQTGRKQYAADLKLVAPPEVVNALNGRYMAFGNEFQPRLEISGHCRVRLFQMHAIPIPDKMTGECPQTVCNTVTDCSTELFTYDAHGT